jgi:hypothetical protein
VAPFQNWPLWSGDSSTPRLLFVSRWFVFAYSSTLKTKRNATPKRQLTSTGLYCVMWACYRVLYGEERDYAFFTEEIWTWVLKFVPYES